ncbi:hypothetical protein FOCC_FOCC012685, partial [Frankliniella occidentalis]
MVQWLEVWLIYKPAQRYQSASAVSYKTINMALKLILLAVTLTAYDSKCPGWNYCSIYTREELAIIYYNSKYCMDLVPDKMVGNRFGYGQVRELCLGKGLD